MYDVSASSDTLRVISREEESSVSFTTWWSWRAHSRPRKSRCTRSTVSPMSRCRSCAGSRCPNATRESRCMRLMTISQERVTVRWYCGLLHQVPLMRPFWKGLPPAVLPTHAPLMVSWCQEGGNSRQMNSLLNSRTKSPYSIQKVPSSTNSYSSSVCSDAFSGRVHSREPSDQGPRHSLYPQGLRMRSSLWPLLVSCMSSSEYACDHKMPSPSSSGGRERSE
mmetsp:Transcript_31651/g.69169  ORF Transcript_31651/g.69169 Transcript_31651/m.69169 type:complete len:222 (+) Transcript_31651:992-1657(+)